MTDLERRMLAFIAASKKPSGADLADAMSVAPEEYSVALRSLHEQKLVMSYVPFGSPEIRAVGWFEITPRGREMLRARDRLF